MGYCVRGRFMFSPTSSNRSRTGVSVKVDAAVDRGFEAMVRPLSPLESSQRVASTVSGLDKSLGWTGHLGYNSGLFHPKNRLASNNHARLYRI